ncbi:MAG: MarR family transcriptional regulator [Erysipelotrichaceae bacterium]|nr:MarR family transcriptional regulator [Erysipelotrichaceae bacterium]
MKILFKLKDLDKMIVRSLLDQEKLELLPSPTQMQIIEYIINSDEEVLQCDLEKAIKLRRATISGVLKTMEKKNLITRVISSKDARVKKIILSDKTKKMYLESKAKLEALEELITSNISDNEINIFLEVMNKMQENLMKKGNN